MPRFRRLRGLGAPCGIAGDADRLCRRSGRRAVSVGGDYHLALLWGRLVRARRRRRRRSTAALRFERQHGRVFARLIKEMEFSA